MTCYVDPNSELGWDALLPYVMPWVRGCPDQIVLQQIRLATIEFCRRSGILHDVTQYDIQAHVHEYQLTCDCNYNIVRVRRVTVDKRWDYTPVNVKLPGGIGAYLFYMSSPTIIHLRRAPNIDNPKGLEVEVIVKPKQDSCVLDNYLYETWAEGIAEGAIARCLSLPNTNWYNRAESNVHQLAFRKELARARTEADRSYTTQSVMRTQQWVGPANRGWGGSGGGGYWPGGFR